MINVAYQISYDATGGVKKVRYSGKYMSGVMTIFLIVFILFSVLWFNGLDVVTTVEALEEMACNIGNGNGIKEAFSEFCIDILEGAELG